MSKFCQIIGNKCPYQSIQVSHITYCGILSLQLADFLMKIRYRMRRVYFGLRFPDSSIAAIVKSNYHLLSQYLDQQMFSKAPNYYQVKSNYHSTQANKCKALHYYQVQVPFVQGVCWSSFFTPTHNNEKKATTEFNTIKTILFYQHTHPHPLAPDDKLYGRYHL